jgi:single-strand DNA-binding protein
MLKMTLIGNLGRDAEVKDVNNRKVIEFSVAHTDKARNETTWVRCSLWRDAGKEGVANYLKKGTQVYVEGLPRVNAYISQQTSQPTGSLEMLVNNLELLGSRREGEGGPGGGAPLGGGQPQQGYAPPQAQGGGFSGATYSAPATPDDDLPF